MEHDKDPPDDDVDAQVLCERELLADVLGREHPDEEAHIEGLSYVVVVYSSDGEPHDGSIRQDVFVQELRKVDKDENRHDMPVLIVTIISTV